MEIMASLPTRPKFTTFAANKGNKISSVLTVPLMIICYSISQLNMIVRLKMLPKKYATAHKGSSDTIA